MKIGLKGFNRFDAAFWVVWALSAAANVLEWPDWLFWSLTAGAVVLIYVAEVFARNHRSEE